MVTDLEVRRLAIADALRAIMAEPLPQHLQPVVVEAPAVDERATSDLVVEEILVAPTLTAEPIADLSTHEIDLDATLPQPEADDDLESRFWTDDDWDDVFDERPETTVPPLEAAGTMSRIASLALFGHA
jgi:hypothetical protein